MTLLGYLFGNTAVGKELLKKGSGFVGSFSDDGSGWQYSDRYPSLRGRRWIANLGLSRGELSVEGATEYDPGFRSALIEMVAQYPELLTLDVRFDGARIPIKTLVTSRIPAIEEMSWLHGTSSAALPLIMASGLSPRGETGAAAVFVGAAGVGSGKPAASKAAPVAKADWRVRDVSTGSTKYFLTERAALDFIEDGLEGFVGLTDDNWEDRIVLETRAKDGSYVAVAI